MRYHRLDVDDRDRAIEEVIVETLRAGRPTSMLVAGTSMEPWFRRGDRVWLEPCEAGALRLGDVALSTDGDRMRALHRVIGFDRTFVVLKGDANHDLTERVRADAIAGRATVLERGGRSYDLRRAAWRWTLLATVSPYSRYWHPWLGRFIRLGQRIHFW